MGTESPSPDRRPPLPPGGEDPRGRVLLVDDNPLTVSMIEQFLLRQGFQVAKSTDPVEALHAELPFVPDVVVLDAMMPGLSGFEFAGMLKQALGAGIRIVMLTALRSGADRDRALAAGADAYLTKPVKPEELLGCIEGQLRVSRAGRVAEELSRILAGGDPPEEKLRAVAERLGREGYTRA